MIIVEGQSIIDLSWCQVGKFSQNFVDREATPMILDDGTDRKSRPFDNRPSPLDSDNAFDIGMGYFNGSDYTHFSFFLNY